MHNTLGYTNLQYCTVEEDLYCLNYPFFQALGAHIRSVVPSMDNALSCFD